MFRRRTARGIVRPGRSDSPRLPDGLALEWSDGDVVDSDEGERLRGRGVFFRDGDGLPFAWDSRRLREDFGIHTFKVAGVSYRQDALRLACFDVGRRLRLLPEPDNPHDGNAIAVWDAARRHQLGYVPRDDTRRMRTCIERFGDAAAIVFHEWRLENGERCSLRALAAPAAAVDAIEAFVQAQVV